MDKFVTGALMTFGAILFAGWARGEGEKDGKKQVIDMIEAGCDVEKIVQKFKGEA